MRCFTRRAVSGLLVQMGNSASVISAPSIAERGRLAERPVSIGLKGVRPLLPVPLVFPSVGMQREEFGRRVLEGGALGGSRPGLVTLFAALLDWVNPVSGKLPVLARPLASLLQGNRLTEPSPRSRGLPVTVLR